VYISEAAKVTANRKRRRWINLYGCRRPAGGNGRLEMAIKVSCYDPQILGAGKKLDQEAMKLVGTGGVRTKDAGSALMNRYSGINEPSQEMVGRLALLSGKWDALSDPCDETVEAWEV
jgi:hypothetical protein